ncbi:conserved hypothetical protein [Trichinella spiralis]|uniref:hypothetical protein n=1 Tax=Trichinella spiralis TaxID=6334 RepID=UPI0001EFD77A|nr:conserved hypothetical protein [Trichinella spiralis]
MYTKQMFFALLLWRCVCACTVCAAAAKRSIVKWTARFRVRKFSAHILLSCACACCFSVFVVVFMQNGVIEKSKCVDANISRGLPVGPHLVRPDVHNRPATCSCTTTRVQTVHELFNCTVQLRAICSNPTRRSFVSSTASTDLAKSRATSGTARVIDR